MDWCVRVQRGTPGRVQYDWDWGVTVYECQNWILGPTPWVMLKKYSALTLTFTPLLCLFLQSTQAASSKNGKAKYLNSNIFIHSIILLIAWIFNFYISFLSSILKTISSNQNSFYNMRTFKSVSFKFQELICFQCFEKYLTTSMMSKSITCYLHICMCYVQSRDPCAVACGYHGWPA